VPAQALAVVGSRAATAYGRQSTLRLAAAATRAGFAIVSGLARGIDRQALEAALDGGGWPVAVLGCGLDRTYPPENERLAGRITSAGTVVSEFPLGTPPLPEHFPPGRYLRVKVDGGTLSQNGKPLAWDDHGYYEVALDAGALTLAP